MENGVPSKGMKILDLLRLTFQAGKPVTLYNIFHGIPITNEATIAMISKGYVVLNVHSYQAVCIAMEKCTYIKGELLPEIVRAHLVAVDINSKEVIVAKFTPAQHTFDKRMSLRVQPKEPLQVRIYSGEMSALALLADVSQTGVGLYSFWAYINDQLDFRREDFIRLELNLPTSEQTLRLRGRITNLSRERGAIMYRVGIQITPNENQEPVLADYIAQRQAEILDELELIYQTMRLSKK